MEPEWKKVGMRRWEDHTGMDSKEIGISTRNWVDSAQDRGCVGSFECGIEPPGSIPHGVSRVNVGFVFKYNHL